MWLVFLPLMSLPAPDEAFFESKVRPVFAEVCARCHGAEKANNGLRLDSRQALLKGGEHGPAIVPFRPAESRLLRAVKRLDGVKPMPPEKPLKPESVADLAKWIKAGAPWPAKIITARREPHWAFEPIRDVAPPKISGSDIRNPIDAFVLAKLREKGLEPASLADRRTLIRRATYDLLGLPPTPEEIEAFLNESEAKPQAAYENLIDRLLASPHYGEKWGRHWLDVVRYADTAGETADFPVVDAWRYRNYVIESFNKHKPFNDFVREQLAGDILASRLPKDASPERRAELIVATGYISIARRFGFDINADHFLTIDDSLDTLGKSFLGLTIGCARCHDHKYDPISSTDYYALYGIFESTRYPFTGCEKDKSAKAMTPLAPKGSAYAVAEDKPHHARFQKRGDPKSLGDEVPRRFLQVLGGQTVPPNAGSGRLQLAEWIADAKNPLTARVAVNRIWQGHFGAGLVKTPNDFGTRGAAPTHPELLDYLARQFVENGWSIKKLHRDIMLTRTYQARSEDRKQDAQDPENSYLGRFSRRRLSAEEIRDAILAVSGDLDTVPGTAHPFPDPKSWGFTQHAPFTAVYDHNKRSVYLMTQRIKRHPFLALFDGADTNTSIGQRYSTTVAPQALFFMNDPFVHARSESLAAKLLKLANDRQRLDRACLLMYGRPALDKERRIAESFLASYSAELPKNDSAKTAWAAWLRVMFGSNEFVFVD
jgi:hypothetical protein